MQAGWEAGRKGRLYEGGEGIEQTWTAARTGGAMGGRASTRVISACPLRIGQAAFVHRSSVLVKMSTPMNEIAISTVPEGTRSNPAACETGACEFLAWGDPKGGR